MTFTENANANSFPIWNVTLPVAGYVDMLHITLMVHMRILVFMNSYLGKFNLLPNVEEGHILSIIVWKVMLKFRIYKEQICLLKLIIMVFVPIKFQHQFSHDHLILTIIKKKKKQQLLTAARFGTIFSSYSGKWHIK